MSIKSRILAAAATLTVASGVIGTVTASAATPECGPFCISIFSRDLGSYAQTNFVEAVLDGRAEVGQPVILKRASGVDPSEDLVPRLPPTTMGLVSDFYAAGLVSAEVNRHYGPLLAAQIEYAPLGMTTGLCVGVEGVATQGEGLTLQPCTAPHRTVFIVDTDDSPATAKAGFFPLVNASTKHFERPYTMDYPRGAHPADDPAQQIELRHLQFQGKDHGVPHRQLWGTHFGPLGE